MRLADVLGWRRERARRALLAERLQTAAVPGVWGLRLPLQAEGRRLLAESGLGRELLRFASFYALGYACLLASWWVLRQGMAAGLTLPLLLLWLVGAGFVAFSYTRQRARWTEQRLGMTHDVVEGLVGYRTRRAQMPRELWHEEEDRELSRFAVDSHRLDNIRALLLAVVPRGWLLLGVAALAPGFVAGSASAARHRFLRDRPAGVGGFRALLPSRLAGAGGIGELQSLDRGRRPNSVGGSLRVRKVDPDLVAHRLEAAGLGPAADRRGDRLAALAWDKSRLYIARALLQRHRVVVLDESLAALDPETMSQTLHSVLRRASSLVLVAHP